jgi:putative ABC transport system substrate-binding protein
MKFVGLLHSGSEHMFVNAIRALNRALPPDVELLPKYADDDEKRLAALAAGLVEDGDEGRLQVIVAAGGPGPALVLQKLTKTIPIVFTTVVNPEEIKLVGSLKKPGNNLTGMAGQTTELDPRRLETLASWTETGIKKNDKIGVLIADNRVKRLEHYKHLEKTAKGLGLSLRPREAATVTDVRNAFADFAKDKGLTGVVVTADSFFNNHRKEVVEFAAASRLPTIYQWREFVDEGGLISFGPSLLEAYEMAGKFVARILDGEKPAKMPCSKPTDAKTFVNGHAAKQLGISLPQMLNGTAVEVIW